MHMRGPSQDMLFRPTRLLCGQQQSVLSILITVACTVSMVIWDANMDQGMLYGSYV